MDSRKRNKLSRCLFVVATSSALMAHCACLPKTAAFENQHPVAIKSPLPAVGENEKSEVEFTRPCCWCVSSYDHTNRVFPIGGEKDCQTLEKTGDLRDCKVVKVIGGRCALTTGYYSGGGIICQPANLRYLENQQQITIEAPPNADLGTCVPNLGANSDIVDLSK